MKKQVLFTVGDRVRYSRAFLRSCGLYTGPAAFGRGTVAEVWQIPGGSVVIGIAWDSTDELPRRVLSANLTLCNREG